MSIPARWIPLLAIAACSSSHRSRGAHDAGSGEDSGPGEAIGAEGGTVSDSDGASVVVPPGALSEPTDVGVASVESGYPALPADVTPRGAVHAFTPHGQAFDRSVTVTVPFDGDASADLRFIGAQPGGSWTDVAGAEIDGSTMRAQVDHFSFFVVVEPEDVCIGIGCDDPFDLAGSNDVVLNVDGAVVLDPASEAPHVIWIPNTMQGTISKVDTTSRTEQARYRTGPEDENDGTRSLFPSRTSVDFRGDVFVVNTGTGNPVITNPRTAPSVTKLIASECDERGDGVVDTSSAPDDVLPWPTADEWDDDCIAWNTHLEDADQTQGDRAAVAAQQVMGLDGALEEVVWVGFQYAEAFFAVDGTDGADTGRSVDVSPLLPYGAAIDRDGFLWAWSAGIEAPTRIDTASDTVDCAGSSCDYPGGFCQGIAIDEVGDVWCGGDAWVHRAETDEWEEIPIPDGTNGGLSNVASDGQGHIYYPAWDGLGAEAPWFYRIDRADPATVETFLAGIPAGWSFYGISIDLEGSVWGLPFGSNASVLDPADDTVEVVLNDCPGGYPDGMTTGCLYGALTSIDMTPFDIIGAATPSGEYRQTFECAGATPGWTSLSWDADVPEKTSLTIDVRTAADEAGLALQPWTRIGQVPGDASPIDLEAAFVAAGLVAAADLDVRFQLTSIAHGATPLVRSFRIETSCE